MVRERKEGQVKEVERKGPNHKTPRKRGNVKLIQKLWVNNKFNTSTEFTSDQKLF